MIVFFSRAKDPLDDNPELAGIWKKNNDGGPQEEGPRPVVGDMGGPCGGYVTK